MSGVQVTFETFDGTWATGNVQWVLDPLIGTGAEGPATVGGTFKVKVVQ